MDTKEIVEVAEAFADVIKAKELSLDEKKMFKVIFNERLMGDDSSLGVGKATEEIKVKTRRRKRKEPVKPKTHVQYDDDPSSPTYDPPPPFNPEPLPPRAQASGRVVAKKGEACTCRACNRIVYTVSRDIKDTTAGEDFLDSFEPYGDAPEMGDEIRIANMEGRITTDCPLCGAKQKLFLVGSNKGVSDGIISV